MSARYRVGQWVHYDGRTWVVQETSAYGDRLQLRPARVHGDATLTPAKADAVRPYDPSEADLLSDQAIDWQPGMEAAGLIFNDWRFGHIVHQLPSDPDFYYFRPSLPLSYQRVQERLLHGRLELRPPTEDDLYRALLGELKR